MTPQFGFANACGASAVAEREAQAAQKHRAPESDQAQEEGGNQRDPPDHRLR